MTKAKTSTETVAYPDGSIGKITLKTESQNRLILRFLQQGSNTITAAQAANHFGIYRLSARIWDLRKQGHAIRSELIVNGSCHWSKYSLIKD